MKFYVLLFFLLLLFSSCNDGSKSKETDQERRIDEISANEDVARYLKSFKGLGALTDGSDPTPALESISRFQLPEDLALDLVLSEPEIVQPVEISFDAQGRLWVVQYSQYPFPKGLKITDVDNFLRFTYDAVPKPPPEGVKGADKISIFEDKGNGKYEFVADAITGLNITTSVLTGRGRIWVLNPPYLLSYPDEDGDGIPDGDPKVELVGFGLEDPHAVANSLRWGPDGWLYGGQGSTVTANISSSVTKNVEFSGQVVWRYNTETEVFEVFAEGGGNTFNLEFDSKGRLFSGNNGYDRGPYFKQGAYYPRSLGKHGGYTNPYTFGNLENMELVGEKLRFTHSMIIYEEGELPKRYEGKMIAINGLNHFVQIDSLESAGSTLRTIDEERIMETEDRWFRPVNIRTGPDGGVYIADWYDSRYSNTDPRDTWNKTTGRIYRLRRKDSSAGVKSFDFSKYSNEELIEILHSDQKWHRQQALQQFGDRRDRSMVPDLLSLLRSEEGQTALEALWAIHMVGGLNDEIAEIALRHTNPHVRSWGVRLLGDKKEVSPAIHKALVRMAGKEEEPEVRSQLACTAKRLPADEGVSIVERLLVAHDDAEDPDIPLLIWWALESNVSTDIDEVLDLFRIPEIWGSKIVEEVILERLMKRLVIADGKENHDAAARLMALAPTDQNRRELTDVLFETQGGKISNDLSADLIKAIAPYESTLYSAPLISGIRKGDEAAIAEALDFVLDEEGETEHKISYINLFGELRERAAISDLTKIVTDQRYPSSLRNAALASLQYFDDDEIGEQLVKSYPGYRGNSTTRHIAIDVLLSRSGWTKELLKAVNESRTISKDDIGVYKARSLRLYDDPEIDQGLYRAWPELRPLDEDEITRSMSKYIKVLESGKGDVQEGKKLYGTACALCHRMDDFGGDIGPDLTGYERGNTRYMLQNTIDPNVFIREGYELYKIFTKDGRAFEGRIVSREGELITLQPPLGGRKTTLHSSEIDRIEEEQTSFMPERLLDDLTDQEVRNLFSFLQKMD